MNLRSTPQRRLVDTRNPDQGYWHVILTAPGRRRAACSLLISVSLVLAYLSASAHASAIDYGAFYRAVHAGDTGTALATGQPLYTRLAFDAEGREPFVRMGIMVVSARQAADYIAQLHADPGRAGTYGVATSLWRTVLMAAPLVEADFGTDGRGSFLRDYLRLYVSHQLERMLAAAHAAASASDASAIATTDHLVLLLGMLDAEAMTSEPAVAQATAWIVGRGQNERAIAQALEHARPWVACAVSRGRLAQAPADPGARREFLDLVGQLCKAQRVQDALALCDWGRDITRDPAYGSVLLLQQAIIAARDQANPDQAIRLCDDVATTAGDTATIQLAKHLAATYCLTKGDCAEAVRRAESLAQDPATTRPYKLKASSLAGTAFLRQNKPQEAIRVLTTILDGQAEPEPAEAADARQLLCQALLQTQRYDEAVRECQMLAARHPGHPAARTARQAVEIFGQKQDDARGESEK